MAIPVMVGRVVREKDSYVGGPLLLKPSWVRAILLLTLSAGTLVSLLLVQPAPPEERYPQALRVDINRAMEHIRSISRTPHPIGSEENFHVRDYVLNELVSMGIDPETQTAIGLSDGSAGTVTNILARLPGAASTRALLLVCHYDSVPTGPGASDDAHAVAILLETLRIIRSGPQLRNDIIFLFSDGEEAGSLGAEAFVNKHPWAAEVGLALNFEARGTGGPAYMFETSAGNEWLIQQLGRAVRHPIASSLYYEIYNHLSNDTDLTAFRNAGVAGLNFAFAKGLVFYHTQNDDPTHVDENSLRQEATYALALSRHFGNVDLRSTVRKDVVYFNMPGRGPFVMYSTSSLWPAVALIVTGVCIVVLLGFRRGTVQIPGLIAGVLVNVVLMLGALVSVQGLSILNGRLFPAYRSMRDAYNGTIYLVAFAFLSLALAGWLYSWCARRFDMRSLYAGSLTLCSGTLMLITKVAPGASYVLMWPLAAALIILGVLLFPISAVTSRRAAVISICALPAILFILPLYYNFYIALGLQLPFVLPIPLVLLFVLLMPHLLLLGRHGTRLLTRVALLVFVTLYAIAAATSGFSVTHPAQNGVFYVLDTGSGAASWSTVGRVVDEWTVQFLGESPGRVKVPGLPTRITLLRAEAPAISAPPPELVPIADETSGDKRRLHLHITSPRHATNIALFADTLIPIQLLRVDDRDVPPPTAPLSQPFRFIYWAVPDRGIDLTIETGPGRLSLRVIDYSYGLPLRLKSRPAWMIQGSGPGLFNDSTLVSREFDL